MLEQVDLYLGRLGRRTLHGMDEHVTKILDYFKGKAPENIKRDIMRDHLLAFEGTLEAQEVAKRTLTEKQNKAFPQWEQFKKKSETKPQAFEQRILDQLEWGKCNPMTIALINAVNMLRDLDENVNALFRGMGIELPNELLFQKPTAKPKEAPVAHEGDKPQRPTISGFASSVANAI